jgi:hypothetical protein
MHRREGVTYPHVFYKTVILIRKYFLQIPDSRIRLWMWFTDPFPRGLLVTDSAGSYLDIFVAIEKNMIANHLMLYFSLLTKKLKEKEIILFSIFFESMIK